MQRHAPGWNPINKCATFRNVSHTLSFSLSSVISAVYLEKFLGSVCEVLCFLCNRRQERCVCIVYSVSECARVCMCVHREKNALYIHLSKAVQNYFVNGYSALKLYIRIIRNLLEHYVKIYYVLNRTREISKVRIRGRIDKSKRKPSYIWYATKHF